MSPRRRASETPQSWVTSGDSVNGRRTEREEKKKLEADNARGRRRNKVKGSSLKWFNADMICRGTGAKTRRGPVFPGPRGPGDQERARVPWSSWSWRPGEGWCSLVLVVLETRRGTVFPGPRGPGDQERDGVPWSSWSWRQGEGWCALLLVVLETRRGTVFLGPRGPGDQDRDGVPWSSWSWRPGEGWCSLLLVVLEASANSYGSRMDQ
ncbi:hypothetical protein NHX12_004722 [Muraenolepis orangiensis]|uniref:Uncharacterized protein n=1 Tax=Muraenolepis orangiensis TaxID=630683 RepID=A0A9Q0DW13_9TELE|nr:hypothetical protein NHX12_004722 [Muraenolepis orangiensis]